MELLGAWNKKIPKKSFPPVFYSMWKKISNPQAKFERFWLIGNVLKKFKKIENRAFQFMAIFAWAVNFDCKMAYVQGWWQIIFWPDLITPTHFIGDWNFEQRRRKNRGKRKCPVFDFLESFNNISDESKSLKFRLEGFWGPLSYWIKKVGVGIFQDIFKPHK